MQIPASARLTLLTCACLAVGSASFGQGPSVQMEDVTTVDSVVSIGTPVFTTAQVQAIREEALANEVLAAQSVQRCSTPLGGEFAFFTNGERLFAAEREAQGALIAASDAALAAEETMEATRATGDAARLAQAEADFFAAHRALADAREVAWNARADIADQQYVARYGNANPATMREIRRATGVAGISPDRARLHMQLSNVVVAQRRDNVTGRVVRVGPYATAPTYIRPTAATAAPVLQVSGVITNTRDTPDWVPPLLVLITDAEKNTIEHRRIAPNGLRAIPAHGTLPFIYKIKPAPGQAVGAVVSLASDSREPYYYEPATMSCTLKAPPPPAGGPVQLPDKPESLVGAQWGDGLNR